MTTETKVEDTAVAVAPASGVAVPPTPPDKPKQVKVGHHEPHEMEQYLRDHNGFIALTGGLHHRYIKPDEDQPITAYAYPAHKGSYGIEIHALKGHEVDQKRARAVALDVYAIHAVPAGWQVIVSEADAPNDEETFVQCVTVLPAQQEGAK